MADASTKTDTACATQTRVVNSYNEWDPLEEIIVGVLDGAAILPWEIGLDAVKPAEHVRAGKLYHKMSGGKLLAPESYAKAKEQLDGFVNLLASEGVVVRRPELIAHDKPFATPEWQMPGGNCQANPRDVLIVFGDEILEATMAMRSRYFEFFAYRDIVKDYFKRGAKWATAPKPRLNDRSYNYNYKRGEEYVITEYEPLFDVADMARCGRDVFIQLSHVTNRFGVEWLERHYPDYRFHVVEFVDDRALHIDATFVPLRPGLIMTNPDRPLKYVPDVLKKGGWDLIDAPRSTFPKDDPGYQSFLWLSMNVLSLDEKRVVVEADEKPLIDAMKSWGLEPMPLPFRENYRFGGSFHCATVDIRRRGGLQSYF
ncbi:MAG TPA: amidinotransferase [Candidatus Binatia bacterium]|nr:amidinotransferase [Candidatus Binatia bacterium]